MAAHTLIQGSSQMLNIIKTSGAFLAVGFAILTIVLILFFTSLEFSLIVSHWLARFLVVFVVFGALGLFLRAAARDFWTNLTIEFRVAKKHLSDWILPSNMAELGREASSERKAE